MPDARLARARRVLDVEEAALRALRERLGPEFGRAIETLLACRGKVIVSGVGKSGIVARKMAATFSSTGTPAVFLHAGEGSHGDLGALARGDVLIAISYSGETEEVLRVLPLARRFAVPLVAMTGRAGSSLGRAGDVTLDVSVPEEACPHNLAPTSSTTVTMALGDALAVALLEERGFTADDFALYHPAGSLGRRLLRVGDLMHGGEAMPLVPVNAPLDATLVEMTSKRLGVTGVIDADGVLAGIVTDGDLRRGLAAAVDIRTLRASDLMTRNPKTIAADAIGGKAVAVMEQHRITSLFVLADDRRPVGVIHLHDLLRAGIV